jgi:hypothetical protein
MRKYPKGKRNSRIHKTICKFLEGREATTRETYEFFKENSPNVCMTINRMSQLLYSNIRVEKVHGGKGSEITTWKLKDGASDE